MTHSVPSCYTSRSNIGICWVGPQINHPIEDVRTLTNAGTRRRASSVSEARGDCRSRAQRAPLTPGVREDATMRRLTLGYLTIGDASPLETVTAAGSAGFN